MVEKITISWDCSDRAKRRIFAAESNTAIIMGLLSKIFSNTRKPEGFFGKMMVNGMNGGGHAQMANWALSSVQIKEDGQILDIGCGGGANIARLLQRAPKGVVQGIDYSSVSVAKSSKVNAKAIAKGAARCRRPVWPNCLSERTLSTSSPPSRPFISGPILSIALMR